MSFSFLSCMLKKQLECQRDTPDHDKLSAPRWRNHIYFPTGVKLIAFVNQDSRQSILSRVAAVTLNKVYVIMQLLFTSSTLKKKTVG